MRMVLVLIALILAVVFAVQNATPVTLNAFFWRFDASLAVMIVLCLALGALLASLAVMPSLFRSRGSERRLKARVAELERAAGTTHSPPATAASTTPPARTLF
ncbi:MAG TPA: LapA family protein [Steroidobacteraceae bacterium]|nr:LapA family protein [Steroidobacteraceae bacterium]